MPRSAGSPALLNIASPLWSESCELRICFSKNPARPIRRTRLRLPMFLLLILGTAEIANIAWASIQLNNAAHAAAQYASSIRAQCLDTNSKHRTGREERSARTRPQTFPTPPSLLCSCVDPVHGRHHATHMHCHLHATCTSPDVILAYHHVTTQAVVRRSSTTPAYPPPTRCTPRPRWGSSTNASHPYPSEEGSSMLEFAVSAIVLFTLLFGCIGLAMALYTYEVVNQYARDASRYAIVHGDGCSIPHGFATSCSIGTRLHRQHCPQDLPQPRDLPWHQRQQSPGRHRPTPGPGTLAYDLLPRRHLQRRRRSGHRNRRLPLPLQDPLHPPAFLHHAWHVDDDHLPVTL